MLRIGTDDDFQKAFPDIVPYPALTDKTGKEGYNDRALFWSLENRGKLRRELVSYATSLDLMEPVDCGTMTHWYSPTPRSFIDKVKPKLLSQNTSCYNEAETLVWDITDE